MIGHWPEPVCIKWFHVWQIASLLDSLPEKLKFRKGNRNVLY
jgi:hypothetical protein